ncbi:MAG: diguanylate cyclase domain-containing protein, partial [Acidimicrobiales bacterium]
PAAIVAAITEDGLFAEMPASVPVNGHRVAVARTALDLVRGEDRTAVIDAWVATKAEGRASIEAALAGTDDAEASIHLFDVTADHGVYVAVILSDASDFQLDDLADIAPPPPRVAYTRKDEVSTIIHADAAVTEMLGWDASELVGQTSLGLIHPDDAERAIDLWMECLSRPGVACRTRVRHQCRDGNYIWLELSNTNLLAEEGAGYVDCEMFDISQEMEAHEAVRAREQLLHRLAEALPVGVLQFGTEGDILYANERHHAILGVEPGTGPEVLQSCAVDQGALAQVMTAIDQGQDIDMQLRIRRHDDGEQRDCTLSIRALTNDDDEVIGGVLVLEDVTEEARMRSELEHRATVDALTGCANRRTALNRLSEALTSARVSRPLVGTAVIFVDLDDFKAMNDSHGHAAGDAVLSAIGSRLQRVVRDQDLVGRIGGDEFLIVCPDVDDEATAVAMAERVSAAMEAPIDLGGSSIHQTASVGVAWTGARPTIDADALIAEADEAMYAAKKVRDAAGGVVIPLHG